jgi:hypothetical protein
VSNLSTYVAGALAAIVVMDHAATIGPLRPSLELPTVAPDDAIESAITINRMLKGDRQEPAHVQRRSRPANAPLEVVDELLTGSTRGAPSSLQDNVTAVVKRAAPARDPQPVKQALPPGCESAFGRLAAPPLAHVPGRCII